MLLKIHSMRALFRVPFHRSAVDCGGWNALIVLFRFVLGSATLVHSSFVKFVSSCAVAERMIEKFSWSSARNLSNFVFNP